MKRYVALLICASCGTLGGGEGGSENLPNRGIAPYEIVGPLIPGASSPSAVVLEDNRVRLYFEQNGDVRRVEGDGETFGEPTTVLEDATSPGAALAQDQTIELAYIDSTGRAAIFREADQSIRYPETTTRAIDNPALAGDAIYYDDGTAIFRDAGDQPVLSAGRAPEVRRAVTSLGRTVYRMMYESKDADGAPVIAFAASFDGASFTDYPQNPLFPGAEPSNIRLGDRYLLYFVDTGTIALAIDAPAAPSETF
jgi:hypothetical protein